MSSPVSRMHDQNHKAQLAAQFNEFYLHITLEEVSQIGNYRIIEVIGEGAFGKVYLARHMLLGTQVVLKCGLANDPNIVREIYYHRQLRHKNIVNLFEVIKTESHLWLALEYCEGGELFYYIYEKRRLDLKVCKKLFHQILEGIRYVHSLNLAHRDLKLENILLADKKKLVVKLTDFGFVREFNPYNRLFLSTVCGTTAYMAPEMLKNDKYSGFAVDIWSLGIVLYAMVYGELPFDEDDELKTKYKIIHEEPQYKGSAPPEAILLLSRMLNKDPAARPGLSEIANSEFLIDTTNKMLEKVKQERRSSQYTDADSIISISQHYKMNSVPFQSRTERNLLKKFEKLNLDIDGLQSSVYAGQSNSLTAFYDLALVTEFRKKKKRYMRKRYYESKLKRSSKRIKSALSLSEQAPTPTQPLEKIISSLSLSSRQEYAGGQSTSRMNLGRRSTDEFRKSARNSLRYSRIPSAPTISTPKEETSQAGSVAAPLERQVSFFPDDRRSSFSAATDSPKKSRKILGKLQFWKRKRDTDQNKEGTNFDRGHDYNGSLDIPYNGPPAEASDESDTALEINIPKKTPSPDANTEDTPTSPSFGKVSDYKSKPIQHCREDSQNSRMTQSSDNTPMQLSISQDSYFRRTRPESVVSQASQYSQLSQLYVMSESEIDMGSDDEYFDDDGPYELSINLSQHDLPLHERQRLAMPFIKAKKKRPQAYRLSSDNLILSASTSATRGKKYGLLQVSSNSSDESCARSRLNERFFEEPLAPLRPISPRTKLNGSAHPKLRSTRTGSQLKPSGLKSNYVQTPMPSYPEVNGTSMPRSHSPPVKKFNTMKKVIRPLIPGKKSEDFYSGASKWSEGESNGTSTPRMFERKSKLGEVEEEDEEELVKVSEPIYVAPLDAMARLDADGKVSTGIDAKLREDPIQEEAIALDHKAQLLDLADMDGLEVDSENFPTELKKLEANGVVSDILHPPFGT